MTRTFQHRFTVGSKCGVVLFAIIALYLFWVKAIVVGLVFVALVVLVTERVLHSEYVFSDDSLTVRRGRFARAKTIDLRSVKSCRPITTTFGLSRYLLIEYGRGHYLAAEPQQEAAFVSCLQDRIAALASRMAETVATEE